MEKLADMIRLFRCIPVVAVLLLAVMLLIPLSASAGPAREYCEREFAEILDQCVLQEWKAQVRVNASDAAPHIVSQCKILFPESYAMQDACISIKEDQEHRLQPLKPRDNV